MGLIMPHIRCVNCKKDYEFDASFIGQKVECHCGCQLLITEEDELLTDAPLHFNDFMSLFYHELKNVELANKNALDLFTLKIRNNDFAYQYLIDALRDILIPHVLSKSTRNSQRGKAGSLSKRAREKFRAYWIENRKGKKKSADKEGELGELLLYAFLESHLKAPKILSKYEIKTANNEYIKGADGVHLLKINETEYQLIFGESKLYKTLGEGMDAAFTSILGFLVNKKDSYETHLVEDQLLKEAYNHELYKKIKHILVPSNDSLKEYELDHAFCIFLGFNYDIDEDTKKAKNDIARQKIRADVKKTIISNIKKLNKKLDKIELHGYSFYVYVVPFSDLANKRREVIEAIVS